MSFRVLALCAALTAGPCFGQQAPFQAGTDYQLIQAPQETSSPAGRIEVVEVFQYGCGGCAQFESFLNSWLESKPGYVDFVRLPAVWNALGELHARAFYTADALGIVGQIHAPFFRAIHFEGNRLDTEARLREFFAGFGVDARTFDATFASFAVHTKVQRAKELVKRYAIGETPSMVVNGKYLTHGGLARTHGRWFEIVEALAAQEREGQ